MKRNFLFLSVLILSSFIQSTYTASTETLIASLNGVGLTSSQIAYFTKLIINETCTTHIDVLNAMIALGQPSYSAYLACQTNCNTLYPIDTLQCTNYAQGTHPLCTSNANCMAKSCEKYTSGFNQIFVSALTYSQQNNLPFPYDF